MDLQVRKGGDSTFGFVNGDLMKTATLRVIVDGYNAPLTAGNFVDLVQSGYYTAGRGAGASRAPLCVFQPDPWRR